MAAPAYGTTGTTLAGAFTSGAGVAVPASVAANNIVLVFIYKENANAVTPPAGFTEAADSPVVNSAPFNLHVFWKRATGADTGTYTFTWSGSQWRSAVAVRYTGCVTTGTPIDVTVSAAKTTTTDGTTTAVSDTTTVADTLLVWAGASYNGGTCTVPTGFAERADIDSGNGLAVDDKAQTSAGATGSVTATFSANGQTSAWLGALIGISSGSSYNVGATGTVTADGTGAAVLSRVADATGTVTVDGSGAAILAAVAAATGTVTAGGTASVALSRVVGAAETVTAGGTAAATNAKLVNATGQVTAGGTAGTQLAAVAAATGQVTAGGAAGIVRNLAATATGTVTAGGTGAGLLARLLAATGQVTAGGTAGAVISSAHPHMTAVSANGRYFLDQNNQPFHVRGDAPWAAMYALTTTALVDEYVEARAAQGYNTFLFSGIVGENNGAPDNDGATSDGVPPFSGGFTLNSTYWARVDYFLQKCRDEGITVLFYVLDSWLMQNSGDLFFSASNAQCQTYAAAVATRYANTTTYPNIVWMVGGDYVVGETKSQKFAAAYDGIRGTGDTRLMSLQVMFRTTDYPTGHTWMDARFDARGDFDFVYSYYPSYREMIGSYEHSWDTSLGKPATRPALLSETRYLNESGPGAGEERYATAWGFVAGSPGDIWGTEDWDFGTGWQSRLGAAEHTEIKALRDWFGTIAWHLLVPDEDLVVTGKGTRATGSYSPSGLNTYALGAVTADGTFAVIYIPTARSFTIDLSKITGETSAYWVDPASGDATSATLGSSYTSSGTNDGGGTDWLLVIQGAQVIDAAGAVTAGGAASITLTRTSAATGAVTVGGSAGLVRTIAAAASGAVTAGGAATASVGVIATGAVTAGGTAAMAVAFTADATGQITAGGVAATLSARTATATGTTTAGGAADATIEGVYIPETPPDRTVVVSADNRSITLPADMRTVTIPIENRTVTVTADSRTISAPTDPRPTQPSDGSTATLPFTLPFTLG